MILVFNSTLTWLRSEREVTGGKTSVGKDRGVDPGEEGGDAGVHIGQILSHLQHYFKRMKKKHINGISYILITGNQVSAFLAPLRERCSSGEEVQ